MAVGYARAAGGFPSVRQGVVPITVDEPGGSCRKLFRPEYLQPAIDFYGQKGNVSGELLAMVSALAETQFLLCRGLGETRLDSGASPTPPADWLINAVGQIAHALGDHLPGEAEALGDQPPGEAEALGDQPPGEAEALSRFAAACRTLDVALLCEAAGGTAATGVDALAQVAAVTGVSAGVAAYVLRMALQPFNAWRYDATPASAADMPFPLRTACPACGGLPLMGKHVDPDGQRFLRCSRCGHEWAFPRIGCPGCGETDQDQIESLFVEGDEGHRLYLCRRCRRYFKVSDERLLGVRAHLPLEDIVTLHLDEIGRQRGYAPVSEEAEVAGAGEEDPDEEER